MQNILSLLQLFCKISHLDQIPFSCDQKSILGCFLAAPVAQMDTAREQETLSPLSLAGLALSAVLKP